MKKGRRNFLLPFASSFVLPSSFFVFVPWPSIYLQSNCQNGIRKLSGERGEGSGGWTLRYGAARAVLRPVTRAFVSSRLVLRDVASFVGADRRNCREGVRPGVRDEDALPARVDKRRGSNVIQRRRSVDGERQSTVSDGAVRDDRQIRYVGAGASRAAATTTTLYE